MFDAQAAKQWAQTYNNSDDIHDNDDNDDNNDNDNKLNDIDNDNNINNTGKVEGKGKEWHSHVSAISVAPEFRRTP